MLRDFYGSAGDRFPGWLTHAPVPGYSGAALPTEGRALALGTYLRMDRPEFAMAERDFIEVSPLVAREYGPPGGSLLALHQV